MPSATWVVAAIVVHRRAYSRALPQTSSRLRGAARDAALPATDAASMSVEFCIGRQRAASQPFG
jgi:hypothetical protein